MNSSFGKNINIKLCFKQDATTGAIKMRVFGRNLLPFLFEVRKGIFMIGPSAPRRAGRRLVEVIVCSERNLLIDGGTVIRHV